MNITLQVPELEINYPLYLNNWEMERFKEELYFFMVKFKNSPKQYAN